MGGCRGSCRWGRTCRRVGCMRPTPGLVRVGRPTAKTERIGVVLCPEPGRVSPESPLNRPWYTRVRGGSLLDKTFQGTGFVYRSPNLGPVTSVPREQGGGRPDSPRRVTLDWEFPPRQKETSASRYAQGVFDVFQARTVPPKTEGWGLGRVLLGQRHRSPSCLLGAGRRLSGQKRSPYDKYS